MTKTIPLDEQIVASLTETWPSAQVAEVLADARRALTDATERADAADVASLNPLATAAEAKKLRTEAGNHRFDADRLEASVSALEARISALEADEYRARREAQRIEALKERDALANDIAREYPRLVATITALAKRVVDNDALLDRAGVKSGLHSAELIGRGLAGWYVRNTPVHRIQEVKIQMPAGEHFSIDTTGIGIPFRWLGLELVDGEGVENGRNS